ncbi:hypothetical protein PGT21_021684 [Puccinia graminis f. sp. tritici]|uniref:Uncharacterized protein n=1 Tax=Puccinia graminis f. sp. tritici TaxID=56615 RepID=A0A5B0PYJ8_PUCGR|nr:hypothetical protein PGT21_021684 [Puccinia graminis f. sp. tritici]
MPSIISIMFFAILACGFATADLATDQKMTCAFHCPTLTEGGCVRNKGRDKKGNVNKWEVVKAFATLGYAEYYNCLGLNADLSVCAEMGKIVLPPSPQPQVMTINSEKTRKELGEDSKPFDITAGDPEECSYTS